MHYAFPMYFKTIFYYKNTWFYDLNILFSFHDYLIRLNGHLPTANYLKYVTCIIELYNTA